MDILNAAVSECGPFFVIFIIIIVVVINVVSNMQKMNKTGGSSGNILGNFGEALKKMGDTTTWQGGVSSGMINSQSPTLLRQKKRPPINWNLIKLNMTPERIRECFDMDALKSGVKKEDLPKYVHTDRLRNYFSEPQLRDMIDLDFFEKGHKKLEEFVPISQSIGSLAPIATHKKPESARPKPAIHWEVVKERMPFKTSFESGVTESISDSFARESVSDKFETEKVSEKMHREDMFDYSRAISDQTQEPAFSVEEIRRAMMWKEILSDPPSVRAYKRHLSGSGGRRRS
ncbi:MAG: hypothetical protein K8T10_21185 [Candidatus Eremiobacteraeota bacterium]|nr:hypothetical protein [Candidatus Eremiobacteraeota bacterium]